MQRSHSTITLRIDLRTIGEKQFGDFLVTFTSRHKQRSPLKRIILRIHIRASSDVLFDGFDVSFSGSLVN